MTTTSFGATSTTNEVLGSKVLTGKRILITGTSSGLGAETARALVARGAQVVGAVRDVERAEKQAVGIRDAITGSGSYELLTLDLSSLESVRACAVRLLEQEKPIDIIINNAGVMATPFSHTVDGFEMQFGCNHLGHFVLVSRLMPLLRKGSRVVSLASAGHRLSDIDLNDLNFERTEYDPNIAYSRSKTANILFAVEFDRRFREHGIRACSVHPGTINTNLSRNMTEELLADIGAVIGGLNAEAGITDMRVKTVEQGAATTVWAAVVADADEIGGKYCEDCSVAKINDGPAFEGLRSFAVDAERAKALWQKSEVLTQEVFGSTS